MLAKNREVRSRLGALNPAFAAAHNISSAPVKLLSSPPKSLASLQASKSPLEERQQEDNGSDVVKNKTSPERKQNVTPITTTTSKYPAKSQAPAQDTKDQPEKQIQELPQQQPVVLATNEARAEHVIGKARTSGKLQAQDIGLETPLPEILFAFPSLADTVDLSLDHAANPDALKPWESHMTETLTVVDFSDNEGITEFPELQSSQPPPPPPPPPSSTSTSTNSCDSQNNNHHVGRWSVERYRSVVTFRARRCRLQKFPITPTLPQSWSQLITLDLSNNALQGEFPLLFLPKSIRELDLSGNKLNSLKSSQEPSTSIDLPQLVNLDISNNVIVSTGISPIVQVPSLQRFNCGNNKLYNLGFILKAIASAESSLTTLSAPKCLLSDLDGEQPIDLTSFKSLLTVDLSDNVLGRVPTLAFAVQRLNVNENRIRSIDGLFALENEGDDDDGKTSAMVVFQIQRNKLKSLNAQMVARLTKLNRLDLRNNALKDLPTELGYLPNLQQMLLEGNHMNYLRSNGLRGELSDTKAMLTKLRNRGPKTGSSPLCSYSSSYDSHDTMSTTNSSLAPSPKAKSVKKKNRTVELGDTLDSNLVGGQTINYSGKNSHVLPFQLLDEIRTSSLEVVKAIHTLNVSKNQLQTIEEDWFTLIPSLTILEAEDNRISSLPTSIQQVAATHLHLSRNRLSAHAIRCSLLHPISSPTNKIADSLQHLDLSSNNLESFPVDLLRRFMSLRTLNLSRNRISTLQNITEAALPLSCPLLEKLNVAENEIENLGGDDFALVLASGCPNLKELRLENNELKVIPLTLGLLGTLRVLDIRGNPQRMIRYDILDKGTVSLLEYMLNRMTSKGKERAGKKLQEFMSNYSVVTERSPAENIQNGSNHSGTKPIPDAVSTASTPGKTNSRPSKIPNFSPARKAPTQAAATPPSKQKQCDPVRQQLSASTPVRNTANVTPTKASLTHTTPTKKNDFLTSPLLQELETSIAVLAEEMDRPGISEAKRYAVKKKLAMERSKRLREERRLKEERGHSGFS